LGRHPSGAISADGASEALAEELAVARSGLLTAEERRRLTHGDETALEAVIRHAVLWRQFREVIAECVPGYSTPEQFEQMLELAMLTPDVDVDEDGV
jgi:hypothetical protein